MDIVNCLPIPLQRNVLVRLTMVDLLGDIYLDKLMMKHSWFPSHNMLIYCMKNNMVSTLKILIQTKPNIDIPKYYFLKTIGYAILNENFNALHVFLRCFIEKMCLYQSEIWDVCDNIRNNKFVTKYTPKRIQRDWILDYGYPFYKDNLQVFYEMMISVMCEHGKIDDIMWKRLDISVLSPRKAINNGVFKRLLKHEILDKFIIDKVESKSIFNYVPDELMKSLLRLRLPLSEHLLYTYISILNVREIKIETLQHMNEMGLLKSFICYPNLLMYLFEHASNEIFMFLGNFACDYGFSQVIKQIIVSRDMELWKYVHTKYPTMLFDDITIELSDVYTIPNSTDNKPSENAKFVVDFLNIHKVIVDADADDWLMLAIDADDKDTAMKLLRYPISATDLLRPLEYSQTLGRKFIEDIIISKIKL